MSEVETNQTTAPVQPAAHGESFIKRELNGASFLTLEHVGHMALVVIVTGLLAMGINSALSMWMGGSSLGTFASLGSLGTALSGFKSLEATMALSTVAALAILVPALVVLDRRTRAEWGKRDGYAHRLAYKVPVYGALGALTIGKILADIAMLTVVVNSLVLIGVKGTDFGAMYLHQFLPAFVTALLIAGAWWYVFKLAKGRDMGKNFSAMVALLGVAVVVSLVVTSAVVLHEKPADTLPSSNYLEDYYNNYNSDNSSLEDLFKY